MNLKNKKVLIVSVIIAGLVVSIGTTFALSSIFSQNTNNSKLSQKEIDEYTKTVNRLKELDILEDKLEFQYKNGEISKDFFISEMTKINEEENRLELIEDKYDDLYDNDLYDNNLFNDFDDFLKRDFSNNSTPNNNQNNAPPNIQQNNIINEQQKQEYLSAKQKERELDLLEDQLELDYKTGKISFTEYSKKKLEIEQQEDQLDIILDKYDDLYHLD